MSHNKTVFRVSVADIQSVAGEQFDTRLNDDEIATVVEHIQENIKTYDVIWDAIGELKRISKKTDEENKRFFETYRR